MKPYSHHKPTQYDSHLCIPSDEEDYDTWLVAPVSHTRDSGPFEESNFYSALKMLGGEGDDVEVHRFGHWAPGWYEIILIRPGSTSEAIGNHIEESLSDYPLLDENDHSEREQEEAHLIWLNCYKPNDRIQYIRKHRYQFEFNSFAELIGCVKGRFFSGYASELVDR